MLARWPIHIVMHRILCKWDDDYYHVFVFVLMTHTIEVTCCDAAIEDIYLGAIVHNWLCRDSQLLR